MSTNGRGAVSAAELVEQIEANVAESAEQIESAERELVEWRRQHGLLLEELVRAKLAVEVEREMRPPFRLIDGGSAAPGGRDAA